MISCKNIFLFFILFFYTGIIDAQTLVWAHDFGSTGSDEGKAVGVDAAGNVYVAGSFSGTVNFGPSSITSNGGKDIFIVAYNSAGTFLWCRTIGGSLDDEATAIDVNGLGVFVTGYFQGTVDLNAGVGVTSVTSAGGKDIFEVFYSTAGNFFSGFRIGSTGNDQGNAIVRDNNINCEIIAGSFEGTVDFDPGISTVNLTSAGSTDVFFGAYNSGVLQFACAMGATTNDEARGLAVSAGGNIYITGTYTGTADFDPGAGVFNLANVGGINRDDIFFAKYSSSGILGFAKGIGSNAPKHGNGIAVDASSNVFITGDFEGTTDFDPGAGVFNITPTAQQNIYFAKYNSVGNFVFANKIGASAINSGAAIALDASGNIGITGQYSFIAADFDPGAGTFNLTPDAGGSDIFYARYSGSTGAFISAVSLGGTGANIGSGVALSGNNIYLTGRNTGTGDFDPGASLLTLTSIGGNDAFVARLSIPSSLPITLSAFTAREVNNTVVQCDWTTSAEINNDFFTIERSKDATTFDSIGMLDGAGNSTSDLFYHFVDENPLMGIAYYRLKQTDFDGHFTYSDTVTARIWINTIVVFPNVTTDKFQIHFCSNYTDA